MVAGAAGDFIRDLRNEKGIEVQGAIELDWRGVLGVWAVNMSGFRHNAEERASDRARVSSSGPIPSGYRKPSHGKGLLRNFQPGNAGRPPNTSTKYSETLALARANSPAAMQTLIERLHDPDGRIAVVAANSILERAWGKVREHRPEEHTPEAHVDLTQLSAAELAILVKLADSGRLGGTETRSPPQIEGPAEAGTE
jgi:hypothetical protein